MYDIKKLKEICADLSVLLVEDEEDARDQIHNILLHLFHKVFVAQDGSEALEIYKKERPDIIISDLSMPKMDGYELLVAVRDIIIKQKIIVMSAHTETDVIVKAIRCDVDGYILKPVEANQMFEAIEKTALNLKRERKNQSYQNALKIKIDLQEQQLIHQLEYDALTNLPNRNKLALDFQKEKVDEVILLNIDNFAHINSTYGYESGDTMLKKIAAFLTGLVPKESLYRGSGDEFFITLKSATPHDAFELAKNIQNRIYAKRFEIDSASVRITFSMGIVTVTHNDIDLPYHKAQLAIADMRKLHKNTIGYYHENSQMKIYQQKMHEWAHKTKLALDFDLLVPYYQPIVNIKTGKIEKYECLARILEMESPVSPFYFIEPAKIAGMVTDITRRMIEKAFAKFSGTDVEFSINITDDDLKEEYLIEYLKKQSQIYDIKPSQVVLEVLENISNYDAIHAMQQIERLKRLGYQIAIDDFGAQSSNFSRVQKLQIDYIKIDGSFIKDIFYNNNSAIIVKTIVFYAKECGLKTVAEYVHDKETYETVKGFGVDYVQGYYLSEPLKEVF